MLAGEAIKDLRERRFAAVVPADYDGRCRFEQQLDVFQEPESLYLDLFDEHGFNLDFAC